MHTAVALLLAGVGLLVVALADGQARRGGGLAEPLFWLGLAAIVVPCAARSTAASCSRGERALVIAILGISLYLVKVLLSPTGFTFGDELMRVRTAQDIYLSGRLFQLNAMNNITGLYPGSELVAAVLAHAGHMSLFAAGLLEVGIARLAAVLALFAVLDRASGSPQAAAAGSIVYTCNPNFLFQGAQFSYESVGLPLAMVAILAALIPSEGTRPSWMWRTLAFAVVFATVATHHAASYALALLLLAWGVAGKLMSRSGTPAHRGSLTLGLSACVAAGAWLCFVAPDTVTYLTTAPAQGVRQLVDLFQGGGARTPFTTHGVSVAPVAERVVAFASISVLLILIPPAAVLAWRDRRRDVFALVLIAATAIYPVSLMLRLTSGGAEAANRASEYVYVCLGLVIGMLCARTWRARRGRLWRYATLPVLAVLFAGGAVTGWAHTARLPGSYLVNAGSRSITPEGFSAARWLLRRYGPGHRVATDAENAVIMGSAGRQTPLGVGSVGRAVWPLFFSSDFDGSARSTITTQRVDFVIVDQRLLQSIPYDGRYFDKGEPQRRLTASDLAKFRHPPLRSLCVYSSDGIQIYDVRSLWSP